MKIIKKDDRVYRIIEEEIQHPENRIRYIDEEIAKLEEEKAALVSVSVLEGVRDA